MVYTASTREDYSEHRTKFPTATSTDTDTDPIGEALAELLPLLWEIDQEDDNG